MSLAEDMPAPKRGTEYWLYWATASLVAAFVGGVVFRWLTENDPYNLRKYVT